MIWYFADFTANAERFELSRNGQPVKLQPRALKLLFALLRREGRLLTRQDMVDGIWERRHVSDSALYSQVWSLRQALDDTEKPYRFIGTVHGQGFRFLGDAQLHSEPLPSSPPGRLATGLGGESGPPVVAVLPFVSEASDKRVAALGRALAADLISALSRLKSLQVIARASSFHIGDQSTVTDNLRECLGADFAVTGTLEPSAEKFVLAHELIDLRTGTLVQSDRTSIDIQELQLAQGELAGRVAWEVENSITKHEAARLRLADAATMDAWSLFHLGMGQIVGRLHADYRAATKFFERSTELSPEFARAHAGIARAEIARIYNGGDTDLSTALKRALRESNIAVDADPADPFSNVVRSQALRMTHDMGAARIFAERAIEIAPHSAWARYMMSGQDIFSGKSAEGLVHADLALRLDPLNPLRFEVEVHRAFALIDLRDTELLPEVASRLEADPVAKYNPVILPVALAAWHFAGERKEAGRIAEILRERGRTQAAFALTDIFPPTATRIVADLEEALKSHIPQLLE